MRKLPNKYKEIITYIIFGVLTTAVSWGTYTVFINFLSLSVFWSNLLSWVLSVAFAYITNKLWVFESKSFKPAVILREAASFAASRGVTGIIEIVAVPLLAKSGFDTVFYSLAEQLNLTARIFYTDGIYSKIVLAVIVVILNYFFSKFIIFKNKKDKADG